MFEFEMKGDMNDMLELEKRLLDHLGFAKFYKESYPEEDFMTVVNMMLENWNINMNSD
jgi:hypothetical protein